MKNSSFDHWLRQNFKETKLSLDKDKEWEFLEPKLQRKKSKRRLVFWIFFPCVIGALGSYYFYGKENINERIQMTSSSNELPMRFNENSKEHTQQENKLNSGSILSVKHSEINNENEISQKKNVLSKQSLFLNKGMPVDNDIQHSVSETSQRINHSSSNEQIENSEMKEIQNSPYNAIEGAISQRDQSEKVNYIIDLLPIVETELLDDDKQLELNENLEFKSPIVISKNKIYLPISIQTMGFMGILNQSLKGPESRLNTRLALEKPESVIGASIMLQTKFKRHFGLGIGIDYRYNTLRFTQQFKDTISKTLYGQVLVEKVNANSELTKDTGLVVINEYRMVSRKLYHHRTLISIPVTLSYNQHINRSWSWSSILGLSIPVYQKFNGRILNSSTKSIELDLYGENISLLKIPCSILYGIQVDYTIRPELKLVLGLLGRRELGYWQDAKTGISEKHGSINFQVGMCYRLK